MKNKRNIILALVFIELVVIASCILVYLLSTTSTKNEDVAEKSNISDLESIISLSSYPKVDTTINMQNLANAYISNFTGEKMENIDTNYSNGKMLYQKLVDGTVDIIISKEPAEEELEYAQQKEVEIEYFPIAIDPFVFYTSTENEVDNISLEEIQQIYSGKITKWSEIGGTDEHIRAFQRNKNSENQNGMISLVMQEIEMMKPITEEKNNDENIPVDIVSAYDNAVNSLGYSFYSYAKSVYNQDGEETILDGIKILKINNITPSYSNFQSELYPLKQVYYVAIRKTAQESTKVVRDAMLSNRGKLVAKEAGYVTPK